MVALSLIVQALMGWAPRCLSRILWATGSVRAGSLWLHLIATIRLLKDRHTTGEPRSETSRRPGPLNVTRADSGSSGCYAASVVVEARVWVELPDDGRCRPRVLHARPRGAMPASWSC